MSIDMIPLGYMLKRVVPRPEWLEAKNVSDIYSVAGCTPENFADICLYHDHEPGPYRILAVYVVPQ